VTTQADVVKAARTYVGTPFRHQGRIRDLAIDCVGLVLCVGEDLGLVDRAGVPFHRLDYPDYAAQPTDRFVLEELRRRAIVKPAGAPLEPGDLLAIRVPSLPCHAAVVADRAGQLYMIHAYDSGPRQCVEHILSPAWRSRAVGVFQFPGVTK
jgi:NlpC/P60 family putative phage cell wall peptidase